MDDENPPEIDLPETSVLTESDYLQMYEVARDPDCYRILELFGARESLDARDIEREVEGGSEECIERLVDAGLVQPRIGPRGTGEMKEYYAISSLGEALVEEGVREGVELLASREYEFKDRYS